MSQNYLGTLPPDSTSGTQLATKLVDWQNALHSCHSSNGQRPEYAVAGTQWIDTSTSAWKIYRFDGTNDVQEGWIDTLNGKAYPGESSYVGSIPGIIKHPSGLIEQFGRVVIPPGSGYLITVSFPYEVYSTSNILFSLCPVGGLNPDTYYAVTSYTQSNFSLEVFGQIYLPFNIDWSSRGI